LTVTPPPVPAREWSSFRRLSQPVPGSQTAAYRLLPCWHALAVSRNAWYEVFQPCRRAADGRLTVNGICRYCLEYRRHTANPCRCAARAGGAASAVCSGACAVTIALLPRAKGRTSNRRSRNGTENGSAKQTRRHAAAQTACACSRQNPSRTTPSNRQRTTNAVLRRMSRLPNSFNEPSAFTIQKRSEKEKRITRTQAKSFQVLQRAAAQRHRLTKAIFIHAFQTIENTQ